MRPANLGSRAELQDPHMTDNYEAAAAVAAAYARRMIRAGYAAEDVATAFVANGIAMSLVVNGEADTRAVVAALAERVGAR
jgi:hypothetical protein